MACYLISSHLWPRRACLLITAVCCCWLLIGAETTVIEHESDALTGSTGQANPGKGSNTSLGRKSGSSVKSARQDRQANPGIGKRSPRDAAGRSTGDPVVEGRLPGGTPSPPLLHMLAGAAVNLSSDAFTQQGRESNEPASRMQAPATFKKTADGPSPLLSNRAPDQVALLTMSPPPPAPLLPPPPGPHMLWQPAEALPYVGREVQDVVSMRLEPTTVFPRRTKVLCLYRSFQDVVQTHLVGVRPHFDHPEVVSRIELFGCPDSMAPPPGGIQGCVTFYSEGGCEELMAVFDNNNNHAGGGGGGGSGKNKALAAAAAAATAFLRDRSFHYPPDTGYLLGSAGGAIHTVVLRVHYDSRALKGRTPVQDTSGVTLYTTPILRRHSIGSFFMDLNLYIAIPPHVSQFSVTGTCRAKGMVPLDANLTVFAHYDHTHGMGTGVEVEVTDEGGTPRAGGYEEEPPLPLRILRSRRVPVSPPTRPLQPSTGPWMLSPPLALTPHRKLELKCEYNSLMKSTTTYAASDAERGEMCMFYMWYYPREPRLMTAVRCKKGE